MTDNIELLLITGAGASTAFGSQNRRLPMMAEFNDAIINQLVGKPGFQMATGLISAMDGHQFERKLGEFLQATRAFPQVKPLLNATAMFPGAEIDAAKLERWHNISQSQLTQITQDIFRVTYDQFVPERVDITSAQAAYQTLIRAAGLRRLDHRLVVATVNYETVADRALEAINWHTKNGSGSPGAEVDVHGLLEVGAYHVPVLHLHGCLGWYRQNDPNGAVRVISTDNTKYDPGYGDPVVLLPEPNKDYDTDPLIGTIWAQFREALKAARRVLIIGHSLNDAGLVEAVRDNIDTQWVGVTTLPNAPEANAVREAIGANLPGAHDVRMAFGDPLTDDSAKALNQWFSDTRMAPPRNLPSSMSPPTAVG